MHVASRYAEFEKRSLALSQQVGDLINDTKILIHTVTLDLATCIEKCNIGRVASIVETLLTFLASPSHQQASFQSVPLAQR